MFIVNPMNYPHDKSNELPWSSIRNLLKSYHKFSEQKLQKMSWKDFSDCNSGLSIKFYIRKTKFHIERITLTKMLFQ